MNGNLQSGGLILKTGDSLFITDIKNYSGTYVLPIEQKQSDPIHMEGVFWFMNEAGNFLYYSDQLKGNAICRLDVQQQTEEVLLNKPCYQLLRYEDYIYYIHEEDQRLYRYDMKSKRDMKLVDEQVDSFLIHEGLLYMATPRGIMRSTESGDAKEIITSSVTTAIIRAGGKLVYADNKNKHVLTLFDPTSNEIAVVDHIVAASINTDGKYIYCANHSNGRSIYRVDPVSGSSIRICGESADYLHVVDNEIYFCSDREWHKLSLLGGEASPIQLTGRYSHEL